MAKYTIRFRDQIIYSGEIVEGTTEHKELLNNYDWDKERDHYFNKDEIKLNKESYPFYNSLKEKFTIKSKHLVLHLPDTTNRYIDNEEEFNRLYNEE